VPLAKRTGPGGWRIVADPAGKPAVTDYVVLGSAGGLSWLELRPRTGRTHQIRVHCAELGFPVLGDPFYGHPGGHPGVHPEDGVMLHLHSRAVALPPLSASRAAVAVSAPVPPHMAGRLARLGYCAEAREDAKT
ncbi:MAG TPA: RNA pseudouridine synthase, partial [Arenibaculum sp.]|nr:RNA pseudouridine synthase [Arenibaculum sp.]